MAASKFTRKVFVNQDSNFVAKIEIIGLRERESERERERERESERERETHTQRDTETQTQRDRQRDRDLPFHQCVFEKSFFKE